MTPPIDMDPKSIRPYVILYGMHLPALAVRETCHSLSVNQLPDRSIEEHIFRVLHKLIVDH